MNSPRRIALLGATGSIGTQTVDVVRRLGSEHAQIVALAARKNTALLAEQARETGASQVAVTDENAFPELQAALKNQGVENVTPHAGDEALIRLATLPEVDTVVIAVAGAAALRATIAAAGAGKRLCIATKEVLVAAGALVKAAAKSGGATLLPIDSEHSALFQCVQGYRVPEDIRTLYLTASGGPFRTWTQEQIENATLADALNHPTWRMGGKITVDSATLMNKGLEIIEASVLFDVPENQVEVVVHPQSIVHSMVEMTDGALLAQLGRPDMRLPIQIALMHPEKCDTELPRLRPAALCALTFEAPDTERFPALNLARQAARASGAAPAILNAANEAAVALFLQERIRFTDVYRLGAEALSALAADYHARTLDAVCAADHAARDFVGQLSRKVTIV